MQQWQLLKKLSNQQRLEQAFQLSDFVRELAIDNIQMQYGTKMSKEKLLEKLRERLI